MINNDRKWYVLCKCIIFWFPSLTQLASCFAFAPRPSACRRTLGSAIKWNYKKLPTSKWNKKNCCASTCEMCISSLIISRNYCVGCFAFCCAHISLSLQSVSKRPEMRKTQKTIFIVKLLFYLNCLNRKFFHLSVFSCEIRETCVICVKGKAAR